MPSERWSRWMLRKAEEPPILPTTLSADPASPGDDRSGHDSSPPRSARGGRPAPDQKAPMTVLLPALGLLVFVGLTLGTAVAVATEFSLTALERSQVDRHLAAV